MEMIGTIFTIAFVALVIGAALTFGLVLFVWFLAAAALIVLLAILRAAWYRWRFLQAAKHDTRVIEVDYQDISDK